MEALPGPVPARGWTEYTEYARRLDEVRAQENARTAGIREGAAEMSDHADSLQARLETQRRGMSAFAQKTGLKFTPGAGARPQGPVEPQTELSQVARLIDAADRQGADAANRALQPNLLPASGPGMRGFAVYGVAALAIMVIQLIGFLTTGNNPGFLQYGVIVPLLGFVIASLVLRQGGKTLDPDVPAPALPTRMGLLLCFGALPVLFGVLVVLNR
ncbi:hypothetical protein [Kineosporia babensis]|uniref:Uncharacterized protein n=1 Tax=Kineosporia babensis TaxID=499548 RepID=A0A9X1NGU2_9ACTN|nr:hypothetical protein [Kineosporia babensis]MCD5313634.1 hypothetical protein [Kineosporia babensis]